MKQKLMSLDRAFLGAVPWLSWENVAVIGKNNMQYLITAMRATLKEGAENHTTEGNILMNFPLGSPEHEELKLLTALYLHMHDSRHVVLAELVTISKDLPDMPMLPHFGETIFAQGEPYYKWRPGEKKWELRFHVESDHGSLISFTQARLLQAQKDNTPFISIWKEQSSSPDWDILLALELPTQEEVNQQLEKFVTEHMCDPRKIVDLHKQRVNESFEELPLMKKS